MAIGGLDQNIVMILKQRRQHDIFPLLNISYLLDYFLQSWDNIAEAGDWGSNTSSKGGSHGCHHRQDLPLLVKGEGSLKVPLTLEYESGL